MEAFLSTELLVIELLLIVSLVAIAVHRLRIPYTVALVVVGLLYDPAAHRPELTPELILALLVPPLVFEAAFHINVRELRRNLAGIFLLAVPGVFITALIVAGYLVGMLAPLSSALVFGALISATDPIAVVALFRELGVPGGCASWWRSESLFNDGTAIVAFNLMLAIALTGHSIRSAGLAQFLRVCIGGLAIGLVLGWLIGQPDRADRRLPDRDDADHGAGIRFVPGGRAAARQRRAGGGGGGTGLGNIGPRGMSPTTRIVLFNFWEYVAFLANSLCLPAHRPPG